MMTRGVNPSPRRLPAVAPAFKDGFGEILSAAPVQALIEGIQDAAEGHDNWSDSGGMCEPTYRHTVGRDGQGGVIDVFLRRGECEETQITEAMLKALWDEVRQLDDLTADVLLAAFAQSLLQRGHGGTWITTEAILDYRGIKPNTKDNGRGGRRRAGHRLKDRAAVARAVEQLDQMYLRVSDVEVFRIQGNRRKPEKLRVESKAIAITDRISQGRLGGGHLPVAWHYQLGQWARPFVVGPSRQMALLAKRSLGYDPYHQVWEKRLSRYFAFQWRMRGRSRNYEQPYQVTTLLEAIAQAPNERYPEKTRSRLENALERLQRDGVILSWQYKKWDETKLPPQGWLARWLRWSVTVAPPTQLTHHYERPAPSRKRAPLDT